MTRVTHAIRILLLAAAVAPAVSAAETTEERVERMERELQDLKQQLKEEKAARERLQEATPPPVQAAEKMEKKEEPAYAEALDRVKVGGYGSFRFEDSSLDDVKNTFTFRRFVLTTDANLGPRLRANFELEFERFRKLELEKTTSVENGGLRVQQAVEGTNDSEISLEQAWLQYDLAEWARFRGGAILVPVGRFNLMHDDNRWDLPRRSLVDRGVSVLPVPAAWDELGVGFNGDIPFSDTVLGSYQLYVMNGVSLDSTIEQVAQARVGDTTLIASEVELEPTTGAFDLDNKDGKAVSGRFALSPSLGSEIATSFYWGRYTPDYLPNEDLYSISGDGKYAYGPFEIEGEYVFTHFGGVERVAQRFAEIAINTESEMENDSVEHEVEFELSRLASDKQGYWVDLRYRFWPQLLNKTVLGSPFQHPQMIVTFRGEQVWLGGLIREATFTDGVLTSLVKENRHVDRVTLGLAYRPVPLVVFQLAYEYTLTDSGKSLSDVTNFLPAKANENDAHAFLAGAAFGF